MKKVILSFILLVNVFSICAQHSALIKGTVIDVTTQKPVTNAKATLLDLGINDVTNEKGAFEIVCHTTGSFTLQIQRNGFITQLLSINIEADKTTDVGIIALEIDITAEAQLSLITLTETDLEDDNSGSENTAALLQATRDIYLQIAAFNWGQARFKVRGLDNEYGTTMINGIPMNKIHDGKPQWSNWGGLNDATRNQEYTNGSRANDYAFGSLLGTQQINTRASIYRPNTRVSLLATNTNYKFRTMATHASGLNKKGWGYVLSASGRWANEGFFEGTHYNAVSAFTSIEKKLNNKHSLNFTGIVANNVRGKNSPLTQEQINIMGYKYNSYWGLQNGKKRNAREKNVFEPIYMLSHYWVISDKATLNTSIAYQKGYIANSRLGYQNAPNPDPTYYKNLPSYYINTFNSDGTWTPNYKKAEDALIQFKNNAQINWSNLYRANLNTSDQRSVYVLYEDRTHDNLFSANTIFTGEIADNVTFNAAINYKKLISKNYQKLTDLLGGQYYLDINPFYTDLNSQSDLNHKNRKVYVGDAYGYNYRLYATLLDAFTQFKIRLNKADLYLAQQFSRSEYQREGLYKNGIYSSNSIGKSQAIIFENFGFKGGATYRISGNHIIDFNALYQTKAPNLRNSFTNVRINNSIVPNLASEKIIGTDVAYIIRMPRFKGRFSGFYNKISDATKLMFYYTENLGSELTGTNTNAFISEILSGLQRQNIGIELGIEYQLSPSLKIIGGAAYGEYIYSKNATITYNDDALAAAGKTSEINLGTTYIKNYKQGGMPQQAYSVGLEYRNPKYWWIGGNLNYLDDLYIDPSVILRTKNFVTDNNTGNPYPEMTEKNIRELLKQKKLNSFTLINIQGGKSWRVSKKNRNTIGFFATINNALNVVYKTGGFEQSRKATYVDLKKDLTSGTPSFGPKYFHGYGRTYFANMYFNF